MQGDRLVASCPEGLPQSVQLVHLALLADHPDVIAALEQRHRLDRVSRIAVHVVLWSCKLTVVAVAIVAGYVIKSGIGVDLWPGDSPLHFIYQALLQR